MPRSRRAAYGTPVGSDGEASRQLRELALEQRMKKFGNRVGLLALSWLAAAIFVILFAAFPITQPTNALKLFPAWVSQVVYFLDFLLFGLIFYGVRSRKLIYWKLTPLFLFLFILSFIIFVIWYMILGIVPWPLCLFLVTAFSVGEVVFCIWWRNQKSYFA
jgi:hypothetical protein